MTVHPSHSLSRFVFRAVCAAFLLSTSVIFASDYLGPVFPEDTAIALDEAELLPLPMPKRNHLLQRPGNTQVVYDDLEPAGSIIPQTLWDDEGIDFQQIVRQEQTPRQSSVRRTPTVDTNNAIFTDDAEMVQGKTLGEYYLGESGFVVDACEIDDCGIGPFFVPYGSGLFDNVSFFSEAAAFKTGLNAGSGSIGMSEGINWAAAVTPQGAATAQYGVRGVQGDMFDRPARTQIFMTAGVFKRFEYASVQGGAAVDWLQDTSRRYKTVNLQQLRCEVSARVFSDIECGFMGGFGVFGNRPRRAGARIYVQDYYLIVVRKPLDCGGQAEIRGGASERGEIILGALCEVAINDRLALNGGLTMLCPTGGQSRTGNYQENWTMSMGVVYYFRGGAVFRQGNPHRPMFDVAGNNSFFTRTSSPYEE